MVHGGSGPGTGFGIMVEAKIDVGGTLYEVCSKFNHMLLAKQRGRMGAWPTRPSDATIDGGKYQERAGKKYCGYTACKKLHREIPAAMREEIHDGWFKEPTF